MADTKITALTALTAADPSTDVLPIVDTSDTTMAASGTTKKISINNLLSSSPTASGNLTITGDLTVDTSTLKVDSTNDRVGIGTSTPATALDLTKTSDTASREIRIENSAVRTFLGVEGSSGRFIGSASGNAYFGCSGVFGLEFATNNNVRMVIDTSGNLGLGVTPSAWISGSPAVQLKYNSSIWAFTDNSIQINQNAFYDGAWKYINAASLEASNYYQNAGKHMWRTAGAGTAGNTITWTQAMTLDASGNLGINGSASATGIDTGVTRLFVVAPNSNIGYAATLIADSSGRGLLIADQGKTNSFGVDFASGLVKAGAFTSGTSVAFYSNAVERVRMKSTGQVRFVPLAADPSGAEAGDVYYNSTSNKLKCYNGTSWNDLF